MAIANWKYHVTIGRCMLTQVIPTFWYWWLEWMVRLIYLHLVGSLGQIFGFRGNRYTNCVTTTAHNSTLCLVHFFPSGFCIKYKYKWTTKSFPPLCSDFQTSVKCTLSFDFCKIGWNRFGHNSINLNDTKNLFDWLKFSQIFEQRSSFLTTSVA